MIGEREYIKNTGIDHRKKYAQFFTPKEIADFMAEWVNGDGGDKDILEPAFGLGVFSYSLLKLNPNVKITAYEIDKHILDIAQRGMAERNIGKVHLFHHDYLTSSWSDKYDGIICNPPYLKFHDYDNNLLVPLVNDRLHSNLSKFTNLYTLFLMKSMSQLRQGGRCAYIIPSEFLNADYGVEVKRYLKRLGIRLHLIIVDFEENVFDGAITTACIVLGENSLDHGDIRFSKISKVSDLRGALKNYQSIQNEVLDPEVKWKNYYDRRNSSKFRYLIDFSTYAKVSRGIATGANKYYTFSKEKAVKFAIPQKALLKCVCHCTDIDKTIFTEDDFKRLEGENRALYLFNGVGNEANKSVSDYINLGEKERVQDRFLCHSRNPWYSIEKRKPAPIWVSVFNRDRLKFVRNEAMVSNLTTFHCLYLTSVYVDTDILFAYLLTNMAHQIFLDNSRQYGNGLVKFEPNDLNKAKVVDLGMLSEKDKAEIKALYNAYKVNEDREYINMIETILLNVYALG